MAKVSGGIYILLAAMILLLPLPWLLAAIAAAAFHELCHYAAIRLLTRNGSSIQIFTFGARIYLPEMSRSQELLCTIAGPLGGLSLLLLAKWFPRTAICAAFQSLYNLLPLYPLDGGRAVSCLLSLLLSPPRAAAAEKRIEQVTVFAIFAVSAYAVLILHLGLMPLLMASFLILRWKFAKMPCKEPIKRVQ